ncbi:MAG: hypothetical protein N2643_00315 [Endomicrobia bacterium]|nr:hypothetical protein [Endomicrobiia bacterium]
MKNCKKLQRIMKETILNEKQRSFIEEHVSKCESCRKEYTLYTKISEYLKSIKYKDVPNGFTDRLHGKLQQQYGLLQQQLIIDKIVYNTVLKYSVVFAIFFIILFSGIFCLINFRTSKVMVLPYLPATLASNYEIKEELPVNRNSYLRVKINSKKELSNVNVQIILPKEVVGTNKDQVVSWKGNLKTGENHIILKVNSAKEGEYPVEIILKKNSKEKKFVKNIKITKI